MTSRVTLSFKVLLFVYNFRLQIHETYGPHLAPYKVIGSKRKE